LYRNIDQTLVIKTCSHLNVVPNRAMRFVLGVGKFTPTNSVAEEMAWTTKA